MRRRFAIALLPLALLVGAAAWWNGWRTVAPLVFQGYAEAEYVKVAPLQPGLLTELAVRRGDQVAEGAALFAQDAAGDQAARDEAAGRLVQAASQLANLEKGGRPSEIEAAEAEVRDAGAGAEKAAADLVRGAALLQSRVIARQRFDELTMTDRQARARLVSATARLATTSSAARIDEIAAQRAAVEAARAALAQTEWRLAQRRVAAPKAALVADTMFRPGEHVAAGQPVVSLLPPENMRVRFFVSEAQLASLWRGQEVSVACDGCAADLRATIRFIAPQPEYTPPIIYSEASRSKLVFLVEAHPAAGVLLNPGQPVEVRLLP
jgi:HlyD family secretion protein